MSTTISLSMTSTSCQCPQCGYDLEDHSAIALDAQNQIDDLQAQVRLLNQKATAAVDKWADYEDEIQALRASAQQQAQAQLQPQPSSPQREPRSDSPSRFSAYLPVQNRLSSFLTSRKSIQNLAQVQPPPSPSATELVAALTREQALRQAAEGKLDEASGELEELSAQLFQQANEMVATERKARAKLEERVEVLERRDGEKRKRLERLEVLCRGLSGCGGCLRRRMMDGKSKINSNSESATRAVGSELRTGGRFRRRKTYSHSQTRSTDMREASNYYPSRFRHLPPPDLLDHLPSLPLKTLDLELWINELCHDFFIEPTPYLVASAIIYLGFILLVGQYWEIMWEGRMVLDQIVRAVG
ncbi:hypothetical protein LOCC1_G003829 [Lachnellula occidentalis]|uniref:GDP/GTP exchange factor Sec2 N-terminal domain-containing protein n=1 Tax=Lachnellula occidentalis TaxID=215460 RepID=A0A8H8RX46_9HELO|nr:hypothetical protein LOCC1_G003829 [Lachnellula occidentalis]